MRYLITGGTGFIGTHLIEGLLSERETESIEVLDLRPPRFHDSRLRYTHFDIRKPQRLHRVDGVDMCVHLAALCQEPGYNWDEYFATNYQGTKLLRRVLEDIDIRSVVFVSTMMVYRAQEQAMTEEALTAPDTAYGMSKLLAEKELEIWAASNPNCKLRILRPGVVFGKGEDGNFTRLYRALRAGRFAYVGRKDTVKGCVYVKDVVRCVQFLARNGANLAKYNLAISETTTIERICKTMIDVLGLKPRRIATIPYPVALAFGHVGQLADALGLRTSLHPRRIQKLYHSTNLLCNSLSQAGFTLKYDLRTALSDWRNSCGPNGLV